MKVKEIDKTANVAWSPSAHHPIYLAAGTAAQQLDATFSTTASLEVYDLNLGEPGLDMILKGSIVSDYRFHKIVWGCVGMKASEKCSGVIVGGSDSGNILMYDPAKIVSGEDALLHHKTNHSGPVHSLDFNKFQECLLASGAGDSEIFIWDLNNPSSPMTPGSKSQPTEDVTCVAWNCQVQHILASTFPARCVVWDLRKNEPIIKVSDSASRMRCKMVAWHPEVATQLCIASDDDHSPLVQLWDLRFATTPVRNLEQHQRGVLSIAWCPQDPDLLLSCGKDNRILCWNPNSSIEGGEIICELPTSNQWCFDVAWCPRNPAVIASSSCDGHVCAYSLMGGQTQTQCSSKIAESFPGSEMIVHPHISVQNQRQVTVSLKKPPKWLRKPVGASFSFGGKLISFGAPSAQQYSQQNHSAVYISQVVTEPTLLNKASELESALKDRNLVEFCHKKADLSNDKHETMKWSFLEATFAPAPRAKMLSLLGYDYQSLKSEVPEHDTTVSEGGDLSDRMAKMSTYKTPVPTSADGDFDSIAELSKEQQEEPFVIKADIGDADGLLNRALLTGNIEAAVDLCLSDKRWADALVLAQAGGYDLLQKTQKLYFKSVVTASSKLISAVATSNWSSVIKNCEITSWKECLAAILTYAKPEEFPQLCELLGNRLETERNGAFMHNAALCYISSGNLERLAELWTKTTENLTDVTSLQVLVEQIMVLRHAVEQLSGSFPPLHSGTVSAILGKFAALLASQGNLKSASMYLVDSKEYSLAVLRDRIYQCLGLQTPFFPFERIDVPTDQSSVEVQQLPNQQPQLISTQPSVAKEQKPSFYPPYQVQQPLQQTFQPYVATGVQPAQTGPFSYTHPSNVPQYQVVPPPHVTAPSSMPQPVPTTSSVLPPPPSDTPNIYAGKSSSGHHVSQRYPKHLHDPSVYAENLFSSQQYYHQQSSYSVPQPETNFSAQNIPQQPVSYYSTEQSMTPAYSMTSSMPSYPPAPYSNYPTQEPSAAPIDSLPATSLALPPLSSSYAEMKTGWNDPPLLRPPPAMTPHSYQTPSAITTPLVNAPVPDVIHPTSVAPTSMVNSSYLTHSYNSYAPQPQVLPPNTVKDASAAVQPQQAVPDSPKEKGPIPPQHQIIQDTFEDLRQQCQQVATNPQTRRKLEDVAKKLEILYDKLREKSLSGPVEEGLHQIVQSVVQSDYSAALTVHGLLVSSTNFSEISGFMPSIKVLLQTAVQHGVFLQ